MTIKDIFKTNPKVSIILPMYNAKITLNDTLESVFSQSYNNWEVIIVDDCSTDNSYEYARSFTNIDKRIKLYKLERNSGPGAATKYGFEKSTGGFIAFLDSDDIWLKDKLKIQLEYMIKNDIEFVCSDYEQIDIDNKPLNKVIKCKIKANYQEVLRTCPIGSSSVIITASLLSKVDIPIIRKNNDYALWLRILKKYENIYGIQKILMLYRVWPQSISYNKFKKIKYFWKVYREYENISIIRSCMLLVRWSLLKIMKIK